MFWKQMQDNIVGGECGTGVPWPDDWWEEGNSFQRRKEGGNEILFHQNQSKRVSI